VLRRIKTLTTEAPGDMGFGDLQVDDLERFTESTPEE